MKSKTTNTTFEQSAFSISSADVSASTTGLAGVVAVDQHDCLSKQFSLVLDEVNQFTWTPASNQSFAFIFPSILSFPSLSHFHSCNIQFFKSDCIARVNYALADTMICISDKPSFSSANSLQVSHCGTSAFSLKAAFEMFIPPFDCPQFFAVEELIVRSNDRVICTPVNANNVFDFSLFRNININYDVEKYSFFLNPDSRRIRCTKAVFVEVRGYDNVILPSSLDCADIDLFRVSKELESVMIKSDRAFIPFDWSFLKFEPFKHIASLVTNSSYKTAVEFGVFGSDLFIAEKVQFDFVEDFMFHSNINTSLASPISQEDSISKNLISLNFCLDCELHKQGRKRNIYKYVSFLTLYEPKKDKTCDVQHQLPLCLVPKIQKASVDWSNKGDCRKCHSGSMQGLWLGTDVNISSARPSACVSFGKTILQSSIHCEGIEGQDSKEGNKGKKICQEILEPKLLCRNSRNSHRTDCSEIHSRTRTEVSVNSPLHYKCRVPLTHDYGM